jgi:hypothetical protein
MYGPLPHLGRLVGGQQQHIAVPGQPPHVSYGLHQQSLARYRDVGVQSSQSGHGRFGLGPADVRLGVDDLAAQVGQFDQVGVHAVQPSHSGGGQGQCGDAAGSPDADHRDPGPP